MIAQHNSFHNGHYACDRLAAPIILMISTVRLLRVVLHSHHISLNHNRLCILSML